MSGCPKRSFLCAHCRFQKSKQTQKTNGKARETEGREQQEIDCQSKSGEL